jgi:hypothetical protein
LNVNCPATQQPQQQFAGPAAGLEIFMTNVSFVIRRDIVITLDHLYIQDPLFSIIIGCDFVVTRSLSSTFEFSRLASVSHIKE